MYDYAQLVDREHLLCPHYIPNDLKLVNVPFPCQVPTDDLRRFLKRRSAFKPTIIKTISFIVSLISTLFT